MVKPLLCRGWKRFCRWRCPAEIFAAGFLDVFVGEDRDGHHDGEVKQGEGVPRPNVCGQTLLSIDCHKGVNICDLGDDPSAEYEDFASNKGMDHIDGIGECAQKDKKPVQEQF